MIIRVLPSILYPTLNLIYIEFLQLDLGNSIKFNIKYVNVYSIIFTNKRIEIKGEDYNNWSSDDGYIKSLILSKLELIENTNYIPAPPDYGD